MWPGVRAGVDDVSALYDLAPLRSHLLEIVDFDTLNSGSFGLAGSRRTS